MEEEVSKKVMDWKTWHSLLLCTSSFNLFLFMKEEECNLLPEASTFGQPHGWADPKDGQTEATTWCRKCLVPH